MAGVNITFSEHSVVEDAAEVHLEESLWQENRQPLGANVDSSNVDDLPF